MSVKIMAEVWEHSQAKGSELLLLLALSHYADSVRAECWPSVRRLALMIRMSERNTQYLLRKLAKDGHIAITLRGSPRKTNLYRVLRPWCKDCTGHEGAGATGCTVHGAKAFAPDPKSEPKPEERERTRAREEEDVRKGNYSGPEKIESFLRSAGILETSDIYQYSMNGHQK